MADISRFEKIANHLLQLRGGHADVSTQVFNHYFSATENGGVSHKIELTGRDLPIFSFDVRMERRDLPLFRLALQHTPIPSHHPL